MQIAKSVIENLNQFKDQKNILLTKSDFFGNMLSQEEKEKLMVAQNNQSLFN